MIITQVLQINSTKNFCMNVFISLFFSYTFLASNMKIGHFEEKKMNAKL